MTDEQLDLCLRGGIRIDAYTPDPLAPVLACVGDTNVLIPLYSGSAGSVGAAAAMSSQSENNRKFRLVGVQHYQDVIRTLDVGARVRVLEDLYNEHDPAILHCIY